MACRTVAFRTVLIEAWRPLPGKTTSFSMPAHKISVPNLSCGCSIIPKTRNFHVESRHINCSNNENPSSSSDDQDQDQGPPQEAVLKVISEVSKAEGRVGQTTNVVIGGTVTDDSTNEWLSLDKKVNS